MLTIVTTVVWFLGLTHFYTPYGISVGSVQPF